MKNQPKTFTKITNIFARSILIIGLLAANIQAVHADDPAPAGTPNPTPAGQSTPTETDSKRTYASESFDVTNLSDLNQEQSYFKSSNPIASFIVQTINFLARAIGSVAFLCMVVGGFILLVSHGNENLVSKGKDIIKYALLGLVIALSAYFITRFVQGLLYELPSAAS